MVPVSSLKLRKTWLARIRRARYISHQLELPRLPPREDVLRLDDSGTDIPQTTHRRALPSVIHDPKIHAYIIGQYAYCIRIYIYYTYV